MERILTERTLPGLAEGAGFWYLGSPYSKYPFGHEQAARTIERIAGELVKRRVRLFCPIAHSHAIAVAGEIDPFCHETWMFQDEAIFPAARGLIVTQMLSWEDSVGLTMEREAFVQQGKPVWLLDPTLLGIVGV